LVISAQALLFGFGLILSLVGVLMWVGAPVFRFFAYLLNRERTETVSYRRLLIVTGSAAAVLIAAFTVIPWPLRIAAPAIVQYSGASRIYTETSGIVTAVHVQPGQKVKLGQLLFQLSNRELQAGLRELKLSIEQTRIRARQYQLQERLGAYQAELSSLENLQRKLAETQAQVDALQVLAPNPGTIVARELDALVDQFLRSGTEVLMIADEAEKKLTLSIHQDDIAHFRAQLGQDISVSLLPPLATDCRLDAIVPRASDEVSHDALIAPSSGPIAVRPNESPGAQRSQWRYLSPRFQGTVHLSAAEAQQTRVGQTAQVKLSAHDGTLGGHLYKIVRNWFRQQLTRPTKATA
jgi:putative peptide zinc metalloprotease protein